jgi:hypothetical protein
MLKNIHLPLLGGLKKQNRVATFIQAWYPQANEPPNYINVPNHINKQVTKVHNN